jgi:hypothetical protein
MSAVTEDALVSAVIHFVGQTRAYVLMTEGVLHEIGSLQDGRAARLLESMRLTLGEGAPLGTLRRVEQDATDLLRSLRTETPE